MPESELIPSDSKHVSYSQYSKWLNCPRQWKLEYVDKDRDTRQSIDTIFGTAIHETIQEWLVKHFEDEKKARKIDISQPFKDKLIKQFSENVIETESGKEYLCDKFTLQEYYQDGCEILSHVQKYAKEFFPTNGFELVGCEIELDITLQNNLKFIAYLDIVIKDVKLNQYHIIDMKTSKSGWYQYQKTDPKKLHQILLYKDFYSKKFNVPPTDIFPKFIILKRQIPENSDFIIRRLSNFIPAHGTISMKKAQTSWKKFIGECFTADGSYNTEHIIPTPSESACKYCKFNNNIEKCPDSVMLNKKTVNKKILKVNEVKIDQLIDAQK